MNPIKPRATPTLACLAALLAAGCGSSSPQRSSATATSSSASPPATLKVSTTPRFASPGAAAPVRSGVVQVAYRNITISPDTLRVKAGTTVVWTNYDPVEHNVTSVSGPAHISSGNFGQGHAFRVTLAHPGVIHYLCTVHPTSMNGTIEVVR